MLERRAPFEMLSAVWPILEAYGAEAFDLVSLTLTGPDGEGIFQAARDFALAAACDPGSGVFVARDVGEKNGHEHFHGLALTREVLALIDVWSELAGGNPRRNTWKVLTGWNGRRANTYGHPLAGNVANVLFYALKPLPPGYGRRSLETDVLATGVFLAPWRAARAAAQAAPVVMIDPLALHRTCRHCGAPLVGKRKDAQYCKPTHRKAAHEAKKCKGVA